MRAVGAAYWDFFDHHVPLTERSLAELFATEGFDLERIIPRFLPFTTVVAPRYPLWCVQLYLCLPPLWRLFGGQFLVVARRPNS